MTIDELPDEELIEQIRAQLRSLADAEKAPQMQAYMKSEMPFLGVQTPHHRRFCKQLFKAHPISEPGVWRATALTLWHQAEYREERYCVLNLLNHPIYRPFQTLAALPMYRELIVTGAWWDLADNIAPYGICALLERAPGKMQSTLRNWASGGDLWLRRSAIICQLKRKHTTDTDLLYDCIEPSIGEPEFFLRKAIGWALREYAKTDSEAVLHYVEERRDRLSTLSKREALRRILEPGDLKRFLRG